MSWPAYAEYKESGIEWLSTIPSPWSVAEVKHTHTVTLGKMLTAEPSGPLDVRMPYLRAAHIPPTGFTLDDPKEMWFTPKEQSELTLRRGDVVVVEGGMGGYGRCDIVPEDVPGWGFQNSINRLRPKAAANGSYTKYLLQIARQLGFIDVLCSISTMPHLTAEKLGAVRLPCPSREEQDAIASFLDRETAKIDALIAKQEQLIATLREDRAATITQAVTKGLDPDVEMKDSGSDRLGYVPVHWTVPQVGWHTTVGNGATPARDNQIYWTGGTIPWLNSGHVNRDEITDADQFVTEAAVSRCHLPLVPQGSVLVGLTGQGKTRGMASLLTMQSTINQHLAYLTPSTSSVDVRYLLNAIHAAYEHLRELSEENGSTKGGLTCAAIRKLRIPLPPISEQCAIVRYLEDHCTKVDRLIAKSARMIDTLREYRSALITDAVTGKIDVREAV